MTATTKNILDSYENHWDLHSQVHLVCAFIDQYSDYEISTERGSLPLGLLLEDYLDQQSADEIDGY